VSEGMAQFFDTGGQWRVLNDGAVCNVSLDSHHPYFADHQVYGQKIFPGVACLELVFIAILEQFPALRLHAFEEIVWMRPIVCNNLNVDIQIRLSPEDKNRIRFQIDHAGEICCYGFICDGSSRRDSNLLAVPLFLRDRIDMHMHDHFSKEEIYNAFANMGIVYGSYFQCIAYVQRYADMALSWLYRFDEVVLGWVGLMDCSFQVGMAISIGESQDALMPYSLGRLTLHKPLLFQRLKKAFVLTVKLSPFRTSITVFDEEYCPLLSVFDLGVKSSNL